MSCESCAGGTDLKIGDSCSICCKNKKIIGYRKCEVPQCQADEDNDIPIIEIN